MYEKEKNDNIIDRKILVFGQYSTIPATVRSRSEKKDVIKVAKLHAKKMIRACQEAEKLCKILMTARKLHSMKLSCQRDSILVAIKTKLQVAIGDCP